jgi:hypothetical protein
VEILEVNRRGEKDLTPHRLVDSHEVVSADLAFEENVRCH